MIIVMKGSASEEEIESIKKVIKEYGYESHVIVGKQRTVLGAVGSGDKAPLHILESYPCVEKVVTILQPFKLVSSEVKPERSVIKIGKDLEIGGDSPLIFMAGPCSVENREQILHIAEEVAKGGAKILRGGAYKPRTSPYSFQGLEEEGLKFLAEAREKTGLKIVTEVMEPANVELVADYTDILQIGARNMQNYPLLKAVGSKTQKPILLKRGMSATIKEVLMAAEYIVSEGNQNVILCERGIRTFETATRNTMDISSIPVLHSLTHLPVIADPSHGVGIWQFVQDMALASVAAGADGLIIEVHHEPSKSFSDGGQALLPKTFAKMVKTAKKVAAAIGKKVE